MTTLAYGSNLLAPLQLLIALLVLTFPLAVLFAVQGVLWILRKANLTDRTLDPKGWALVAWWVLGLVVLSWLRRSHFPPHFW